MPLLIVFLGAFVVGQEAWVAPFLHRALKVLIAVALEVSHWPGAVIAVPSLSPLALGLFTGGALWIALWQKPWRWAGLVGIVAAGGVMATTPLADLYILPEKKLLTLRDAQGKIWANTLQSGRFARETWVRMIGAEQCQRLEKAVTRTPSRASFRLDGENGGKMQYSLTLAQSPIILEKTGLPRALKRVGYQKKSSSFFWPERLIHVKTGKILCLETLQEKGGCLIHVTPQGFRVTSAFEEKGKRPWSQQGP